MTNSEPCDCDEICYCPAEDCNANCQAHVTCRSRNKAPAAPSEPCNCVGACNCPAELTPDTLREINRKLEMGLHAAQASWNEERSRLAQLNGALQRQVARERSYVNQLHKRNEELKRQLVQERESADLSRQQQKEAEEQRSKAEQNAAIYHEDLYSVRGDLKKAIRWNRQLVLERDEARAHAQELLEKAPESSAEGLCDITCIVEWLKANAPGAELSDPVNEMLKILDGSLQLYRVAWPLVANQVRDVMKQLGRFGFDFKTGKVPVCLGGHCADGHTMKPYQCAEWAPKLSPSS